MGFIASRVYGKKKNQLVGLRYFEDIAGSGFDCRSWEDRDHLASEQLMYLKHFKKRFLNAFEFIPRE